MAGASTRNRCPDAQALEHFLLALTSGPESDAVGEHLLECEACCRRARALAAPDAFVEALCQVPPTAATQPPEPCVLDLIDRLRQTEGLPATLFTSRRPGAASADPDTVGDFLAGFDPPDGPEEVGRFAGYRVLGVLGVGGMGAVYKAEQVRPRRLVALKLMAVGAHPGREHLARFRAEAEVAARLQHPHIVPVYEVGEHAGRPFFSMEYVAGGSLAQKLALAALAPRTAAQLLEAVAWAVQHAHAHGVVHRDLKPGNVLLTPDGTPKVADFGLAKALPGGVDITGAFQTASGAVLGTPNYMAPEQAEGGTAAVGPAADVYALGAILYEMLTGRPPFRAASVLETLEQVRTHEPIAPRSLNPGCPRDLQTICLKCLEKEPARRYASAGDVADDLGRFLKGEPVRARPVSPLGRLRKWARRKPALAALTAVCGLLAIALGAGGLVHQSRLRAALAQAEANAEAAQAQQARADANYRATQKALTSMVNRLESNKRLAGVPRLQELQRDLLEDALAFYQELLKGEDNPDPAVRLDAADIYVQTGAMQYLLGRREPAEEAFLRADALLETLPDDYRNRPWALNRRAECCSYLADIAAADGRRDDSERYWRMGLALRERLAEAEPGNPVWQNSLAQGHHQLGSFLHLVGRLADAEAHYARAVAIRTRLVADERAHSGYRAALAEDHVNLGQLYDGSRRREEAAKSFAEAVQLLSPLVQAHPERPEYALSLAAACINWGNLLRARGQLADALAKETQAVDLADAVLRQEPQHDPARTWSLSAHGSRALVYEALGRPADAVPDWDRVVELVPETDRPSRRVLRGQALVKAGAHARAAAEAKAVAQTPGLADDFRCAAACIGAQAVQSARADRRLSPAERDAAAEAYGAEAVAQLRRLVAAKYFQKGTNQAVLQLDPSLAPLRSRADFQELLKEAARGRPD
jgi:serine/threonine-protein kinase